MGGGGVAINILEFKSYALQISYLLDGLSTWHACIGLMIWIAEWDLVKHVVLISGTKDVDDDDIYDGYEKSSSILFWKEANLKIQKKPPYSKWGRSVKLVEF